MVDEVVTTNAPWGPQQAPLIYGFGQAQNLYNQGTPQYFPGSTVAQYGADTTNALNQYRGLAGGPQPGIGAAMEQSRATLAGDYLNPASNPYLAAMSDAIGRQTTRQYQEGIAPSLQAQFANSGRTGSGLYANAMDSSRDTLARGLYEGNANLYGNNYQNERNRQMNALQMAPQTTQLQYQPASQLLNVGQMYDQQSQANIEDQFNRYNYNQITSPYENLGRYMGFIRGNYGGEGAQSSPTSFTDYLGAGLTGVGLAKSLFNF